MTDEIAFDWTETTVRPDGAGSRLDAYLAEFTKSPRNQVQRWIDEGRVKIDGSPAKPSSRLVEGQTLRYAPIDRAERVRIAPVAGALEILYEDAEVVALNKPAGLTVHPGAGRESDTIAHRLLARYPETARVGGPGRPGLVHRLDRDTTGVLLVARTERSYLGLVDSFSSRSVTKRYLGLVYGVPARTAETIDMPIGRDPRHRQRMAVRADGRPARTDYRSLDTASGCGCLALDLHTGRTHQIRVHLRAIGHPLIGDGTYAGQRWKGFVGKARTATRGFERPALHALAIALPHPSDQDVEIRVEAPVPTDLADLWRELGGRDLAELSRSETGLGQTS